MYLDQPVRHTTRPVRSRRAKVAFPIFARQEKEKLRKLIPEDERTLLFWWPPLSAPQGIYGTGGGLTGVLASVEAETLMGHFCGQINIFFYS